MASTVGVLSPFRIEVSTTSQIAPAPRLSNEFLLLAEHGSQLDVEALIEANPGVLDEYEWASGCLVRIAVRNRDTQMLETLLKHGAWPLGQTYLGRLTEATKGDTSPKFYIHDTPLHLALSNGDLDAAELLIRYGADPGSEDPSGTSIRSRHSQLIEDIEYRIQQADSK